MPLDFIHTTSTAQKDFGKSNLSPLYLVLRDTTLDIIDHNSAIGVSNGLLQRQCLSGPLKRKRSYTHEEGHVNKLEEAATARRL